MFKSIADWLYSILCYVLAIATPDKDETKQTLFIHCSGRDCENELVADEKTKGEYIDPDQCIYRYTCGDCGEIQSYDFCMAPVPIKVDL